jgi:hypothetical protein
MSYILAEDPGNDDRTVASTHGAFSYSTVTFLPPPMVPESSEPIEKFLFRQRVLLMCSLNVEGSKGMNDLVKESSMKVGIDLELMESVLKEPATVEIGTGGGIDR